MKIFGCMLARNEEWILGLSARVAMYWCDALVILDHGSTDATGDIIYDLQDEYPHRLYDLYADGDKWDEMAHRQMMLQEARRFGATHIAIIDADEVLTGNLLPAVGRVEEKRWMEESRVFGIRNLVDTLPAGHILQLPGYNLRGGIDRYHSSGIWGKRWFSTVFADDPKLGWHGDRFHHREPMGAALKPYRPIPQDNSGVMHLWGASERRLRAKHAWYKVTERLRWPDRDVIGIDDQYSQWRAPMMRDTTWEYKPVPAHWWAPYAHLQQYLQVDAVPWQEQAVRDAVAEHGAAKFHGLDLFGVV